MERFFGHWTSVPAMNAFGVKSLGTSISDIARIDFGIPIDYLI